MKEVNTAKVTSKKIAAIVVTYNRCRLLMECIEALLNSDAGVDILIVDNASTDNTSEMIRSYQSTGKVIYTRLLKNTGGAGGFHYGIKKAYQLGYEYFWLMDDDTIVQPNTLTKLLEADERLGGSYGFLSSLSLWKDGNECHINYHVIANDWNLEKKRIREGIVKVETATFVSFFITRKTVDKVGLPIKEYFIWGDDTEYSGRISRKYPCYLIVNSTVMHKMDQNIPSGKIRDISDIARIERMFYSVRNDCCTYRRRGAKSFIRYTVNVMHMIADVMCHSRVYKAKKLKAIIKGYLYGVVFHPAIEKAE